jgi:hypothetical protein
VVAGHGARSCDTYNTTALRDIAVGDLDGDQRPEIVVSAVNAFTQVASITVLNNDGSGAFSTTCPRSTSSVGWA